MPAAERRQGRTPSSVETPIGNACPDYDIASLMGRARQYKNSRTRKWDPFHEVDVLGLSAGARNAIVRSHVISTLKDLDTAIEKGAVDGNFFRGLGEVGKQEVKAKFAQLKRELSRSSPGKS